MYNRLIHLTNLSDPSILMHLIRYGEITGGKHLKQWFRLGLDIEDSVWGVFLCFLFYMAISGAFFTCKVRTFLGFWFQNNRVCFVAITVAFNFIAIIIICISNIGIIIVILAFFVLFYPYFSVIVIVSILPILNIEVEPYMIYTLNDLVPCSIGI